MPALNANGITLEYEARGDGEPLVMIMGVGTQLIHWPDELCDMLVERGFRVICFDNRDMGLSTKLKHLGTPRLGPMMLRATLGLRVHAPYTLSDMATDVACLIENLELESAHVLGCSMGGMIAQTLTIEHPKRVKTLTSLMSTTGDRYFGKLSAIRALFGKVGNSREASMDRAETIFGALRGTRFPFDAQRARALAGRSFDRNFSPDGFKRQMAAILSSGSRTKRLAAVRAPTLVMHGTEDPLVPVAAGRATATAIPGAEFKLIEGMGHELPAGAWPIIADAVAAHASATSPMT